METRKAKLIVTKGGSGSSTFRATLPTTWIRGLGLSEEIKDLELSYDGNVIVIEKERVEIDKSLEFLKKDRKVNETFINKLKKAGFEIKKGKFTDYEKSDYVKIGDSKVWMIEFDIPYDGIKTIYKTQNAVINEIYDKIEYEVKEAKISDLNVQKFFNKLK